MDAVVAAEAQGVTQIEIDRIEYTAGDNPTWIAIGHDLAGRSSLASSLRLDTSFTPTTNPTNLGFDANDPNLTTEQKMRLRRAQGR